MMKSVFFKIYIALTKYKTVDFFYNYKLSLKTEIIHSPVCFLMIGNAFEVQSKMF